MKSPFPGMDPYLERSWGDVQTSLALYSRDRLNKMLPPALRARVEQSVSVDANDEDSEDERGLFKPDVEIHTTGKKGSRPAVKTAAASSHLLIARDDDAESQKSIRITASRGKKLVTSIEFLSPANKVGQKGREKYLAKQQEILAAGASLVEVDLVRIGEHVSAFPWTHIPPDAQDCYTVSVVRGWKAERAEVYTFALRDKLPKVKIPLRRTDDDVLLDLQAIIEKAYDGGGYDDLDYTLPLKPALPPEDAAWADRLLKAAGKR